MTAPEGKRRGKAQTRIEEHKLLTVSPKPCAAEPRSSAAAENLDAATTDPDWADDRSTAPQWNAAFQYDTVVDLCSNRIAEAALRR